MNPPLTPAVKLIAYVNILMAGLTLVLSLAQSGDEMPTEVALANAMGDKATPEILAEARKAEQALDLKRRLREHLAKTVPPSEWVGRTNQTADVIISLMMGVSGLFLLQRNPLGRPLALTYAGVSLAHKLMLLAYLLAWEGPAAEAYLKSLIAWSADDGPVAQSLIDQRFTAALLHLLFAAYPFVVIFVLWQDEPELPVKSAEASPPPDDGPGELPPLTRSGPKPPIPMPPPDDDLDNLLKRKPKY